MFGWCGKADFALKKMTVRHHGMTQHEEHGKGKQNYDKGSFHFG